MVSNSSAPTRTAVVLHLDGIVGVVPLVGGYLKAFALADERVAANWRIELWSEDAHVKASHVIRRIVDARPDVVAISVYTWNSGLVRRLLPALRGLLPDSTRFLLGGVEIMGVAPLFVDPSWDDVAVCNGEGERTFRDYLLEMLEDEPDLSRVGGLTYVAEGEFHTTPGHPRVQDLTELPSPWLSGVFDDLPVPRVALFETNRGCPFACEFCFWGGATGQKVYRQDMERLKAEIDWIAERKIPVVSVCDANFGILPRDAELAEHFVAASQRVGCPSRIIYNSSKVRPDRVEHISSLFAEGGLLTRHVFSLQTLSPEVLKKAKRTGLSTEDYREIQQRLNERHMSSVIELLWPMPGETLDSFQDGVAQLLGAGAQSFLIFPLVWLYNTGYREHTEEYGVTVLPEDDPSSGGEIVVSTREVPFQDYLAGLRYTLGVNLLHDCRGLATTMQLLDRFDIASFKTVLNTFAEFMDERATGPIGELWRDQIACFEDMIKYTWRGEMADAVFHHHRHAFDDLLRAFVAEHPDWFEGPHERLLRAAFDWDLLCRPYLFLQTKVELKGDLAEHEWIESQPRGYRVRGSFDLPGIVHALRTGRELTPELLAEGAFDLEVDHKAMQHFLFPNRTRNEHLWICSLAVQEVARIEPSCAAEPSPPELATT